MKEFCFWKESNVLACMDWDETGMFGGWGWQRGGTQRGGVESTMKTCWGALREGFKEGCAVVRIIDVSSNHIIEVGVQGTWVEMATQRLNEGHRFRHGGFQKALRDWAVQCSYFSDEEIEAQRGAVTWSSLNLFVSGWLALQPECPDFLSTTSFSSGKPRTLRKTETIIRLPSLDHCLFTLWFSSHFQ